MKAMEHGAYEITLLISEAKGEKR
ncbi:Protein of unknown function [Bacillus cytotoxicus]|uniref:Uncharacterized protein n=1 Tax=Bacillus cytotoxicus TaxID=580165 RepID=A0AAX2CJ78_9BACI|nr:Protein of unknown function [Bacillus cytotoxicus]SCN40155.1 Protein of unknown function [Bacillus cytotoxicus]